MLTGEQARLLDVLGHAEIFSLKLHVGKRRYFLLFSAAEPAPSPRRRCRRRRC